MVSEICNYTSQQNVRATKVKIKTNKPQNTEFQFILGFYSHHHAIIACNENFDTTNPCAKEIDSNDPPPFSKVTSSVHHSVTRVSAIGSKGFDTSLPHGVDECSDGLLGDVLPSGLSSATEHPKDGLASPIARPGTH